MGVTARMVTQPKVLDERSGGDWLCCAAAAHANTAAMAAPAAQDVPKAPDMTFSSPEMHARIVLSLQPPVIRNSSTNRRPYLHLARRPKNATHFSGGGAGDDVPPPRLGQRFRRSIQTFKRSPSRATTA